MTEHDPHTPSGDHAVYGIAVASELTGVQPAMLRAYEARGLVRPHRTGGGTRRYSADDLAVVRRISDLLASGLNLAGVEAVFALEGDARDLRAEVDRLQGRLDEQDDGTRAQGQAEPRGTL